mmetsp:Transcript_20557/g.44621  ORF Transcript_20557/g.44621 Transcript_20557/m.44621 type:complete len:327 (+) Transcript_20557:175-1155(+)|eukprot:CAMPEP_0172306574 /NCGR_PEP_ID=MMETSP1058-20130122/7622_1 /TAXON_ID=83371 /ORGANISM="Detonula confervacea, Strain CCMP 353" /LENGTH=326 /DNA_ID=CAMNT_0013018509 /DNA_START=135 /DNA_END=1115 /DNA_ORIENTATION=+
MLVTYTRTVISTAGHVSCVCVLFGSNMLINVIDSAARSLVKVISTVTAAHIGQDSRTPHAERVRTFQDNRDDLIVCRPGTGAAEGGKSGPNQVMDEAETLKKTVAYAKEKYPDFDNSSMDILGNEKKLKELATNLICNELGGDDPSLLSDDFQFLFPVVGPLTKTQFVEAFSQFKVREAFPTSSANFYNFKVDPLEPNRIWMMSRGAYEHLGTLSFGPSKFPATNKRICLPPQCFSMSFNAQGKCYKLTGGYNVDRSVGVETEGLGGMFGIVHALGLMKLPFAEGRPWKRSLMWEAFSLRIPQVIEDWKHVLAIPESSSEEKSKSQ